VAKCAGFYHFGRSESLDVETRSHADQMNESGNMRPNEALQSSPTASARTSLPPPGAWSMSLQRPGRLGINKKRKRFYE
jgi:hypothetical protein